MHLSRQDWFSCTALVTSLKVVFSLGDTYAAEQGLVTGKGVGPPAAYYNSEIHRVPPSLPRGCNSTLLHEAIHAS